MRVLTDGEHAKLVAAMKSARDLLIELEREITAYQIAKDNREYGDTICAYLGEGRPLHVAQALATNWCLASPRWQVY